MSLFKMKQLCIVLLLAISQIAFSSEQNIIVETGNGKIEGLIVTLESGFKIDNFLGIKYGTIPERFTKSLPIKPWKDVLEAKTAPPRCMQSLIFGEAPILPTDTEDCLYLNVFAPHEKVSEGYPVMVYIHGGGYAEGYSIDGYTTEGINEWIVSKDVILVNFNYRLGPWGFFSTGTNDAKGNWGLWDQSLLLQWVHDNIAAFGGNSNKVTLFGESAGAISTSLQSVSPYSRNLFHQSILMSASGLIPWFTGGDTVNVSIAFAGHIGCADKDMDELVRCVRSKPTTDLYGGFKNLRQEGIIFHGFTPRIDNDFLSKPVEELILESPPKPFIIGATKDEGGLFVTPFSPDIITQWTIKDPSRYTLEELRKNMLDVFVDLKCVDPELLAEIAIFHYVDAAGSRTDGLFLTEAYSKFVSDLVFYVASFNEAKLWHKIGSPIWLYRFDYYNPELAPGSYHYYDMWYFFKIVLHRIPEYTEEELKVADYYTTLFTNFAKFGNPTETNVGGISWPTIDKEHPEQCLKITNKLQIDKYWNRPAVAFWNHLVPLLNGTNKNGQTKRGSEKNARVVVKQEL